MSIIEAIVQRQKCDLPRMLSSCRTQREVEVEGSINIKLGPHFGAWNFGAIKRPRQSPRITLKELCTTTTSNAGKETVDCINAST